MSLDIDLIHDGACVHSANITHNLGRMASEADLYMCLWRSDELGIETARGLIGPLSRGLAILLGDPERFMALKPPNGWGSYEGLATFAAELLKAASDFPDALIEISR